MSEPENKLGKPSPSSGFSIPRPNLYSHVKISVKTLDKIIWAAVALTVILIILGSTVFRDEAANAQTAAILLMLA
jgi:hypothetical protein